MHSFMRLTGALLSGIMLISGLGACSNSANGVTDRLNVATIHPMQIVPVTASCNSGEQMLSGGWAVTTPAYRGPITVGRPGPNDTEKYFVAASFPASASSWTVIFTNEATGDGAGDVSGVVHVECLASGTAPTIVSQVGTNTPNAFVTAACPNGANVTGGGFKLLNFTNILSQMIDFIGSTPIGLSQWNVYTDFALNSIMLDGTNVEAFAVCTTGPTTSLGTHATVTAPPEPTNAPLTQPTSGSAYATCPTGQTPVGSGYFKNGPGEAGIFPITSFFPAYDLTPPRWSVTAYSLPFVPIDSPSLVQGGSAIITPICAAL